MKTLRPLEILPIGLLTFALFLGAGNIIFPPVLGQQAGDQLLPAIIGFLLTSVGLPLLGVVAAAKVGGGLNKITSDLPKWAAVIIGVTLYLAIGPLFATPRTALVSYEFTALPLLQENASTLTQLIYSLIFFGISLGLALYPGKLVESVGKFITPLLTAVLIIIGVGTFLYPQGELGTPTADMVATPLANGFLQGYQTMDTLGALAFGIVIITAIRRRGITDSTLVTRYTIQAGVIAAVGLSLVYLAFCYLGATSQAIAPHESNGAHIISLYIGNIFGGAGQWLLAITITLACLSTSIGLISACAEYFHEVFPTLSYRVYAITFALISTLIANVGLSDLIAVTIPALLICYPVAIALIVLCLLRQQLYNPRLAFTMTVTPVFIIALIDGLGAANIELFTTIQQSLAVLPFNGSGLGWIVPGVAAMAVAQLISRRPTLQAEQNTA